MSATATLATSIIVGASLASGFRSTVGGAVSGIGEINGAVGKLGGLLAEVGMAWGALRGIGAAKDLASDFSHELAQTGITAGMTKAEVAELREQLRGLAVPDKTNQTVEELHRGFSSLVAAGLDNKLAAEALPAIGRTATAAQADIKDLSATAFVLIDTLGVAPGALSAELDRLAFAGKAGAFELKDMARALPGLGPAVKNLGLQGSEAVATLAAALQMAKKGAADPAEAANNMKNFLAKATAPDTVKRFQEHGVNLKRVLNQAIANGENPMEALLAKVQQMTKGDPFKLGELFGDMQVLSFLKPMLANMEEYKRLKAEMMTSSGGTVDRDFAVMMEENKELTKGWKTEITKLGEAVGRSLLPPLNAFLVVTTPLIGVIGDFADSSPTTTAAIVALGGALTILPPAIRLVTLGWRVFTKALMANPVGLVVGALVIGATLLIDHWGTVRDFFVGLWEAPGAKLRAFGDLILSIWDKVAKPFDAVKEFLGFGGSGETKAAKDEPATPGAGLAAAEKRGQAQMARAEAPAAAAVSAPQGQASSTARQVVEVILSLPQGLRAEVRNAAEGVTVTTRTGPAMVGAN
ncbi:MAG: phage tail tape measure protein [Rhodospirillaceae bacterium]